MLLNKKLLSILIIIIYLILLIPYAIISNAGESGIVIDYQEINVNSLSDDVQDLLPRKDSYNVVLIEDVYSTEKIQNPMDLNQVEKQRRLIISEGIQEKGSFVKLDNVKANMYVAYNILPAINQSFDKLIIGDLKKAKFGGFIETINNNNLTPIFTLSKINFLIGGLFVVLILTFLFYKNVALWNASAMLTGYSFQLFISNLILIMNQFKVDVIYLLFGFLFIITLPFTYKLKKFENTNEGKKSILELYIFNVHVVKEVISTFKNIFGIGKH